MKKSLMFFVGIILVMFFMGSVYAITINADSCSQTDVQNAIDSASDGDTVIVPSGNCIWITQVSIPSSKKIILQGAGMDSTIITRSPPGDTINLYQSGSRLTGFQFINGTITVDGDGWRIDNCKFYWNEQAEAINVRGYREYAHPTGLIDHCVFYNARVRIDGWAGLLFHASWAQPLNLGAGNNVVYIEDSEFIMTVFNNAVDTNYGGRYVFRYNTVNDSSIDSHSVQGNHRATRSWEIYNNTINQVNRVMWVPMFLRGGTGVVFNNIITGTWTQEGIAIDNKRSCGDYSVSGQCNGSSSWDGNMSGENGYPCRDQIGRSTDQWLWTPSNPYPPQALDPAYAWNNVHEDTGNDVVFYPVACAESQAHIQEDRDYYNNQQKPGYIPYTYPHPLTLIGTSICSPADTDSNGVVEIVEIINYIASWKVGSVDIAELMIGIGEWKNGC